MAKCDDYFHLWVDGEEQPIAVCPKCHHFPFRTLMRGQVVKSIGPSLESIWCRLRKIPYARYAIIFLDCKEIVGYEVDKVVGPTLLQGSSKPVDLK